MIASTMTTPVVCAFRAVSVYFGSMRWMTTGALTSPPTRSGPSSAFGSGGGGGGGGGGAGDASVVPVPPATPPTTPPTCPPTCPPTTPPSTPPTTPPTTPPGTPPGTPLGCESAGVVSAAEAMEVGSWTFGNSFGITCGCTNELCTGVGLMIGVGVDFGALDAAGGGGGGGGGGAGPDARKACIGFWSASLWCAADAPMKMMKATMPRWMPSEASEHFHRLLPFCLQHSMSWLCKSMI